MSHQASQAWGSPPPGTTPDAAADAAAAPEHPEGRHMTPPEHALTVSIALPGYGWRCVCGQAGHGDLPPGANYRDASRAAHRAHPQAGPGRP